MQLMSEKGLCHSDDIDQMISLTVITLTVITLSTVLYSNNSTKYSHTRLKRTAWDRKSVFEIIIINGL